MFRVNSVHARGAPASFRGLPLHGLEERRAPPAGIGRALRTGFACDRIPNLSPVVVPAAAKPRGEARAGPAPAPRILLQPHAWHARHGAMTQPPSRGQAPRGQAGRHRSCGASACHRAGGARHHRAARAVPRVVQSRAKQRRPRLRARHRLQRHAHRRPPAVAEASPGGHRGTSARAAAA